MYYFTSLHVCDVNVQLSQFWAIYSTKILKSIEIKKNEWALYHSVKLYLVNEDLLGYSELITFYCQLKILVYVSWELFIKVNFHCFNWTKIHAPSNLISWSRPWYRHKWIIMSLRLSYINIFFRSLRVIISDFLQRP